LLRQSVIMTYGIDKTPSILEAKACQEGCDRLDAIGAVIAHDIFAGIVARIWVAALLNEVHLMSKLPKAYEPLERPREIATEGVAHQIRAEDDARHTVTSRLFHPYGQVPR